MNDLTRSILLALAVAACGGGASDETCHPPGGDGPAIDLEGPFCKHLSSYRLFDDIKSQAAAPALFAYDLNTALFSDYAQKHRWLYLPDGAVAGWQDADPLDLPVGTVIVKTFAFPHDRRDLTAGEDLVETRLLVHRAAGWDAVSYLYDADDADAQIAIAGAEVPVSWIHDDGSMRSDVYTVPNKNQCKNCHGEHDDVLTPLGPKVRHLNRAQPGAAQNQLQLLVAAGKLTGAPADMASWPRAPVFDDPASGTLEARARGYLDINCSHCHNPGGAARTSGVDFSLTSPSMESLGICKNPTAAGRGSGGFLFDIVPGRPDQSIVTFRISSTEADIKMPELSRNLVHDEGVALIRDWISSLPGSCGT
jgi:uncharacterized repeat protein (TIGR03806 family)